MGSVSRFATTPGCVGQLMLKRRDPIQRDLGRLERWGCVTLMNFNTAKCNLLHLDWGSSKHEYRLGRGELRTGCPEKLWMPHPGNVQGQAG